MAKAPTAPKSNVEAQLHALADELVKIEVAIEKKTGELIARRDDIKAQLRKICPDGGKFKWEFPGKGEVELSGARGEREFKGLMPQLVAAAFLDLPDAKREALVSGGIIEMKPQYSAPYYGRVTVKLF